MKKECKNSLMMKIDNIKIGIGWKKIGL